MACVLLFSFSLFFSTLVVGIANPLIDICSMGIASRYSTAVFYCTKEIEEQTDKAVPCRELFSLFKEICSFNSSVIAQAIPMNVTNDSCMILLQLDVKYIQIIFNMTNGGGSIMTLCKTHPDASAVLLALYQLKDLIPVTRPAIVSPETSSTKSPTASTTTSGTRGSDPPTNILTVTSTTSPSMPYTTAKENKSQQTEKATVPVNDTESPDPTSKSSDVKSSSTTTTTIAATSSITGPKDKNIKTNSTSDVSEGPKDKIIKTNSTSDVSEGPKDKNIKTDSTSDVSEGPKDKIIKTESTSDVSEELNTTDPGKKDETANPHEKDGTENPNEKDGIDIPDEKDETDNPADQVGTNNPAEEDEIDNPAEKDGTNNPAEKDGTNNPAEKDGRDNPAEKVDTSKLEDNPSSYNFLIYFLAFIVLCVAVYIVLHNKHKIIAFIIEGKQGRRGGRPSTKQYTPLKSKVEDVMPFIEKSTTQSNYIY